MSFARHFSRNLSFVLWTRVLSALVNLTFLAFAARAFGVVNFGKLVFVLATTSFMELAFCGSADSILVREQTRNPEHWKDHFWACAFLHGCFALIVVATSASLAVYWRADWNLSRGLMLAGAASAFQVMFAVPVAFFRSEQKMYFEAALITAERILFLLGFVSILSVRGGIVRILGCLALTMGMKAVAGYLWFLRRWPIPGFRLRLVKVGYFWKESIPMMGVALLLSAHCRVDLFLTKALSSAEQLGIYAASFRAIEMARVLPVDVITAAFPIFCSVAARKTDDDQLGRMYNTFVRLGLMVALLVTGIGILYADKGIRLLFGGNFTGTVLPIRILLMAFPLMFWNQIDNITLTATQRQKYMFYALIVAVACQSAFDGIFISRLGAIGAGAGFVVGEAILLFGTLLAMAPLALGLKQAVCTALKLAVVVLIVSALGSWVRPWSALLAGAIFTAVFIMLLLPFRVLGKEDVLALRQAKNQAWRSIRKFAPTATPETGN